MADRVHPAQAYPLQWPAGWPRSDKREASNFRTTLAGALAELRDEVRRLGGSQLIISSNVALGHEKPADPGVAAYFMREGEQVCIPCDRWVKVEDNLRAIAKTIEALRGIERWGAKHMVKAAFRGFAALPAPASWRDVLELGPGPLSAEAIEAAYRRLAKERHPDVGGSDAMMASLNRARGDALKEPP